MFHSVWTAGEELDRTSGKYTRYDFKIICNANVETLSLPRIPEVVTWTFLARRIQFQSSVLDQVLFLIVLYANVNPRSVEGETAGNTFFFTVFVFTAHSDLKVTVTCENLSNIVCVSGLCEAPYQLNGTFSK